MSHVADDILHVGIAGLSGELIDHGFLLPTTQELNVILGLADSLQWVFLFDKVGITGLVRHVGCVVCGKSVRQGSPGASTDSAREHWKECENVEIMKLESVLGQWKRTKRLVDCREN